VFRAAHPRTPGVQERLVLEEVQVPPGVLRAVVHRTGPLCTVLGRAGEPGTSLEIQVQIQLGGRRVDSLRTTRHGPLSPSAAVNNPSSSMPLLPLLHDYHGQSRTQRNHHPLVNPPRRAHPHLITKPIRNSEEPPRADRQPRPIPGETALSLLRSKCRMDRELTASARPTPLTIKCSSVSIGTSGSSGVLTSGNPRDRPRGRSLPHRARGPRCPST
jgi:hypothetical protein